MDPNVTIVVPLMSKSQFDLINVSLLIPGNVLITVMGLFSNFANIVIFVKMSPADTMTISLTALALSDFMFSIFNLLFYIVSAIIASGIQVLFRVNLFSFLLVGFLWQRPLFHKVSTLITTFVSCERAFCVVRPFLVKQIFTKRRSKIIMVATYVIPTAIFMPVFVNGSLVWRHMGGNGTRAILVAYFTPQRAEAESIVQMTAGFPLVFSSQIIITLSSLFLIVFLRRHQRFREGSVYVKQSRKQKTESMKLKQREGTDGAAESDPSSLQPQEAKDDGNSKTSGTADSSRQVKKDGAGQGAHQASARENRLMKTVLIIALTHVVLNTPMVIYYIFNLFIEPNFNAVDPYYSNFYLVTADLANIFQALNGLLNIFVYLTLNTKYRDLFKKIFLPFLDGDKVEQEKSTMN